MAKKKEETQDKKKQEDKSKKETKPKKTATAKKDNKSKKDTESKTAIKPQPKNKTKKGTKSSKDTTAKKLAKSDNDTLSAQAPDSNVDDLVIATDFLVTAKAAVRNLAVAITETATPSVKKVLRNELDTAIETHDKIAQYMIKNEMYHAYNIEEQVDHDLEKADTALEIVKKND